MIEEQIVPSKRKAVNKKTRFEVFKRDSFTCQYCGSAAPEVVLNLDHIKPVAKGGSNRITNLVTSCFACNSGKSDRELSDKSTIEKQKAQLDQLQERRNQLEMMMQWHEGIAETRTEALDMVVDYINKKLSAHNVSLSAHAKKGLKPIVKKYPFEDILPAIDIGIDQYVTGIGSECEGASEFLRKLGGICRNNSKDADTFDVRKHYLKGVLRNRVHYFNERSFYKNLAEHENLDIEELINIAKRVSSTGAFWVRVCEYEEALANG